MTRARVSRDARTSRGDTPAGARFGSRHDDLGAHGRAHAGDDAAAQDGAFAPDARGRVRAVGTRVRPTRRRRVPPLGSPLAPFAADSRPSRPSPSPSADRSVVLAAVYGPRAVPARKENTERMIIEVNHRPASGIQSASRRRARGCRRKVRRRRSRARVNPIPRASRVHRPAPVTHPPSPTRSLAAAADKEAEHVIRRTLEQVVLTATHPRLGVTVVLQIVSADGGVESCALNAACAALLDAAVPMRGVLCAPPPARTSRTSALSPTPPRMRNATPSPSPRTRFVSETRRDGRRAARRATRGGGGGVADDVAGRVRRRRRFHDPRGVGARRRRERVSISQRGGGADGEGDEGRHGTRGVASTSGKGSRGGEGESGRGGRTQTVVRRDRGGERRDGRDGRVTVSDECREGRRPMSRKKRRFRRRGKDVRAAIPPIPHRWVRDRTAPPCPSRLGRARLFDAQSFFLKTAWSPSSCPARPSTDTFLKKSLRVSVP